MLVKHGDKTYKGILFKKYSRKLFKGREMPCKRCAYLRSIHCTSIELKSWKCRMFDNPEFYYIPRARINRKDVNEEV